MTPTQVMQLIDKLRRDQPINKLALELCTACEELIRSAPKPKPAKPVSSRAAYMREHRKKERQLIREARAAKGEM